MKKTAICLLISFGIAFLLLALADKPFYQVLSQKLYDLRMNLRETPAQDPRILFVEMDDDTIDQLGRWPWPRNIFANITNTLNALGAKQILFDVTFAQPNQVFIDKEAVGHVFQGKDEINNYIVDETGLLKGKQTLAPEDAAWTLEQIRNGFLTFTQTAEHKLQEALIDNDKVLAAAFANSNVFIGYSFEVLTEDKDIAKDRLYPQIHDDIVKTVEKHFDAAFDDLPASLKNNSYFTKDELRNILLRSRLRVLIQKNPEISISRAADELKINSQKLKSNFYLVKHRFIEEKIQAALEANPQTQFVDIIYKFEIFDPDTQQSFREVWSQVKKEFEAAAKFAHPLSEGQNFLTAKKMDAPIEPFTKVVKGGGFLNGIPDSDGVLRSVPLFIQYKNSLFPHIAITSFLDLTKPQKIAFDPGKSLIFHQANVNGQLKDIRIPIDRQGKMLINWAGRWKDTFRRVSASDIYRLYFLQNAFENVQDNPDETARLKIEVDTQDKILREKVNNSICIIGLTAAGTHDFNPIPYESAYPMVGTHGNALNVIMTEQFITKTPRSTDLTILFALAVVMGAGLAFLSSVHGLLFTAVIIAGAFFMSLYWFHQGVWLNLASPTLLSLFSYLGITSYKFATEEKAKREIKNAFSKYVAPEIIAEIVADPSKLKLGGERKTLTVLFSDIRGFTTYSEKRKPEEVVEILNEYLDAMTKVIVEHKGTLDKYVGDEIMAVFGAPKYEPPEINAKRAVICGMKMLGRLKELHKEWAQKGLEPLDIGIGINTGEMLVGNMGSELRMDYTVIGDAVNLGARVEALTRQFNTYFMITENTYQYAKDILDVKQLEAIKVKGKDIAVMVYDVLALKSDQIPETVA